MAKFFPGRGVKGAVFVVCPECHRPWAATLHPAHGLVSEVQCKLCGTVVPLTEGLRRAELQCSACGRRTNYYTNWTGPEIHVNCVGCGRSMRGRWDPDVQAYRPVQYPGGELILKGGDANG